MAFDAHSNFGYGTVLVAPAPALTGTQLTLGAGEGALFPIAPFNCTVWPAGVNPISSNAEIVRVTAVVGDVLTITRAQESTAAVAIAAGFQIANTTSNLVFTAIEQATFIGAGTQTTHGPFVFADGGGVTFGMNNGTISASVAPAAAGGIAASAGAESISNGTLVFQNGNGISFGLNNSTLTASYTVPNTAGLISFVNFSANANNTNATQLVFADANGITFGLNGNTLTASVAAGAAPGSIAVPGATIALGQAVFSASNGITFGIAGSTMTASHNGITLQSTQPVAASASNGVFNFSTLNFTDANGITFGTSAGSIIFASHNGLTSQSGQAASASNGSFAFQTLGFSNANGVTFGTSAGSIITASVAPSGGGGTVSLFMPFQEHLVSVGGAIVNSASVVMLQVPNNLTFTRVVLPINISLTTVANTSVGAINFSLTMVLHTLNGLSLNSVASTTYFTGMTVASNATSSVTGPFNLPCNFAGSISPGVYWLAYQVSTANTGGLLTAFGANTTALGWTHSFSGVGTAAMVSAASVREFGQNFNNSQGWIPHCGIYSATTNMTNIAVSDIVASASQNRACLALKFQA